MDIQNWFIQWNNKFNDNGAFKGQCVNLIRSYFQELGLQPIKGNAIDYWKDIPNFTRIEKTLFNRPRFGDIVVWNTKVNQYGHIGITNWTSFFELNCFEQNFPIGSPCHFQTHNYSNILGWLRYNPASIPVKVVVIYASGTPKTAPVSELSAKVGDYTSQRLKLDFRAIQGAFLPPIQGMISTDQACQIIDVHNIRDKFVFICYDGNSTSSYLATSWEPKRNIAFCTVPLPIDSDRLVHEFLHMLRRVLKRLDTEVEYYQPDWRFQFQFDQLKNDFYKLVDF